MTHHFFRGGFCEHAHDQHSESGDRRQDHGEVEVVHVLHHAWAEVGLAALGLWVDEVQHQPNNAQQQPDHQAPERALGKEGYSLLGQAACSTQDPGLHLHAQATSWPGFLLVVFFLMGFFSSLFCSCYLGLPVLLQ